MKTLELFKKMKNEGYNVKLMYSYDNNYNQDYCYASINISTSDISIEELWKFVREFGEVNLVKTSYRDKQDFVYSIRKHYRDAELIEQDGVNYNALARREKITYDTQSAISYKDWTELTENFS